MLAGIKALLAGGTWRKSPKVAVVDATGTAALAVAESRHPSSRSVSSRALPRPRADSVGRLRFVRRSGAAAGESRAVALDARRDARCTKPARAAIRSSGEAVTKAGKAQSAAKETHGDRRPDARRRTADAAIPSVAPNGRLQGRDEAPGQGPRARGERSPSESGAASQAKPEKPKAEEPSQRSRRRVRSPPLLSRRRPPLPTRSDGRRGRGK